MSEELLINVSPMESRVALLNDGVLREVYIERHNKMGLVGNIYVGTIVRVLPGMQAAFVDIGQSRTAFLHVNDMQKIKKPNQSIKKIQAVNEIDEVSLNQPNLNVYTNTNNDNQSIVITSIEEPSIDRQASSQYLETKIDAVQHKTPLDNRKESFFSSKQFTQDNANPNYKVNPNYNVSIIASEQGTDKNKEIQTDKTLLLKNSSINQENNQSQASLDVSFVKTVVKNSPPKFGVLSTVNNILTKDSLRPSLDEKNNENGEGLLDHAKVDFKSSHYKKQPQVHSAELIQNRLRERQQILVQVTKDQLGTKGARLTTNISLPSRYLVYLPSSDNIGVSQRIEKEAERTRLKTDLAALMQKVNLTGGLIARTAAEGVSVVKLQEDIEYLLQLWSTVQKRKSEVQVHQNPVVVYQELSLPLRSLRDLVHEDTERVVVDDAVMYEQLKTFAEEFVPMIFPRIVPYHSQQPMFDVYRVEQDLSDALKRRVDLKSGGYLIIDQTEAMTTIDVNTGSFVGGRSLEDTVYKTNLEATHAIARQLRLRNLGGIIILDFIDMQEQEHRDDVLISLQNRLSGDYARTNITQVSELGLVEMTRKRTRESLEQILCEPCTTCEGKGFIKTSETVCFEIFREIMRCARTYDSPKKFTVVAHSSVIDLLLTSEADTVADLEYLIGRVITFDVEGLYTQEQYDIVLD